MPATTPTRSTSNGYTNGHSSVDIDDLTTVHDASNEKTIVQTKGHEEGHTSHTDTRSITTSSHAHTFTNDQHVTVLRQTVITTRSRLISELSHVDAHYIDSMTVESFLKYTEHQRLTHMPRRGSRWDRVLTKAEFFALQISRYQKAVHSFVPDSRNAAKMIWAAARVLIELGPCNAQAIETAFEMFYKAGLSLSFFLQQPELLSANSHIRTEVGQVLNELLVLVRDVSLYYRTRISALSSTEVSIDFSSVFSKNIFAFYKRKDHIIDSLWECRLGDDCTNVRVIRQWLDTRDNIARTVIREQLAANNRRHEHTCEWMGRPLLDFSRGTEDVLAITGPSGSGKSILAGWIVERLQKPLNKKMYETLSVTIDPEIPIECSALAIAKKLTLQLLQANIGDVEFLNVLEHVHKLSVRSSSSSALETELWKALDIGLKNSKADNLMIVIDGLDDRLGHQNADTIGNKLGAFTSRYNHVRAIILSRNTVHLNTVKTNALAITPDHTHNDLQHLTEHALKGCEHFSIQNDHEQEATAEKVTHAAKGNFLTAQLIIKSLKRQESREAFKKATESIKETHLESSIQKLVSTATADFTKPETNLLLSWLLVAERPLTVSELKGLLQVDLQKKMLISRKTDIVDDIQNLCGLLVRIQNGIVRFRHGAIRDYLAKVQIEGKKLPTVQSAQGALAIRLLAYCNLRLIDPCDPGFERPDSAEIDRLFLQDTLLEYATRNWILHFKKSSWYKATGPLELPNDFKANFPGSVYFSMIEWACWELQTPVFEAIGLHNLALRLRQAVFTEKHHIVLQTLIICGNIYRKLSNVSEAGSCFYRASRIGQSILKANSVVTLTCTTSFLEVTETITSTTRTEIISQREEMFQYAITACKHQYGKTSDIVIRYCTTLAEMYVAIHEESKAETVYRELHEIIIIRHGKGSVEETTISGHISVVLKADKHDEIIEYEKKFFDTTSEMEIWDVRRITVTLKLAAAYEVHGELFKAEELYVTLWSRLVEHCHQIHIHHVDITVRISMMDVSLEYVRFLRRCHRDEEAAGVLICIWNEYEEYDFESEVIFLRLKIVGELMRAISLLSIAVSVFKKCWSWFKLHEKHEHVKSCQILISETTEEIITTTQATVSTTTSTTTTTTTETIIKEVFESTISKSIVTKETISICRSLVSFYFKSEQWSEVINTSKRSLQLIWRMIVSGGGTIALPREFAAEAIEIAIKMAICHQRLHHFHEAESVYIRIYRACFNSCHVNDERLINAYTTLVKFYQEYGHWHKVIEVYREVLIASRTHLGATHALTIKILYELGSLCSEHGHGYPDEYYEEIITVLNGKSHVCHHEAFRAMQIMSKVYYEQGHWQKLKINCEILWEFWTHHHTVHKFEAEFIELLYMRYIYILEHHYSTSHDFILTITLQFRDTCVIVFGASATVVIRALVELAQICMRSEKHIHEAISYYEEVIKTVTTSTKTTTTTTTVSTMISTVKQQLTKAYIHVCTHGTASSAILERAVFILTERFEHLKIHCGYSHIETLTVLRELIKMRWSQSTKEAKSIVVRMLLETAIAIISEERHSRTLYEAAKTIGSIYVTCGLHEEARKVLYQIHKQIVSKSYTSSGKHDFKIDHSVGRGSYVFLVTFEETILSSSSISYSKIMADLLTETILYESYSRSLKSEKNIEVLLRTGACLYAFLVKKSRREQVTTIQEQLHKIFLKKWGANIKTRNEITIIFVVNLLQVLGNSTHHIEIDHAACKSSNEKVRELMSNGQFKEAYEVAHCAFQFLEHRGAYHHLQNVGYGFKLSAYIASRGVKQLLEKPVDPELRAKMLELSRDIIREVLKACKDSEINFVRLNIEDLNDLIGLLGEQQNYADLEWLLKSLWSSRNGQKKWSPDIIIAIGKRFVQARFLGGNSAKAINLCEDIYYNFSCLWGSLDPKTLEMSDLLSQIYTAAGHHREAMRLHEEILRLVVEGDDGDDRTLDTMTPKMAKHHLSLLKVAYQRLGGWDKHPTTYKKLVDQLLHMPEYKSDPLFKGVHSTDKWNPKDKPDTVSEFTKPVDWEFVDPESLTDKGEVVNYVPKHHGLGFRRVTSNWGLNLAHQHLLGGEDEDEEMPERVYMKAATPDILVK